MFGERSWRWLKLNYAHAPRIYTQKIDMTSQKLSFNWKEFECYLSRPSLPKPRIARNFYLAQHGNGMAIEEPSTERGGNR